MKTATVKEFRNRATEFLRGSEPLPITRHGQAVGLFLPLTATDDLPVELRKELQLIMARAVRQALEGKGIAEEQIREDFEHSRK